MLSLRGERHRKIDMLYTVYSARSWQHWASRAHGDGRLGFGMVAFLGSKSSVGRHDTYFMQTNITSPSK